MKRSLLLTIDSLINFLLGTLLIIFPRDLVSFLGIPQFSSAFYPSILGSVLFGIGIALWMERGADRIRGYGLGLGGAVAINLCGALVLITWLLFGNLSLSTKGFSVLWGIAMVLIVVSVVEISSMRHTPEAGKQSITAIDLLFANFSIWAFLSVFLILSFSQGKTSSSAMAFYFMSLRYSK